MRVLMISTDRGFFGSPLGDVVERHRRYGTYTDGLDIIVFICGKHQAVELSDKVRVFPTNSRFRLLFFKDAHAIGGKLFRERPYNLVVTQDPFVTGFAGVLLARRHGVKLLVHFHGDFWGSRQWLRERFLNPLLYILSRYVVRKADRIRVVRKGIRNSLVRKGIAEQKISIIPTPIKIDEYLVSERAAIERIIKEFGDQIILFVGRLTNEKNISLMLKAVKVIAPRFPQSRLIIIGDGPLKQKLLEQARRLGVSNHVHFLGQIEHTKLFPYYGAARVLVNTSMHEGYPKTFIEAFVNRTPVVATATNGTKEVINDTVTGFIVPIGDERALAEKIFVLLEDKERALLMGERGRAFVQRLTTDTTEQVVKLWKSMATP